MTAVDHAKASSMHNWLSLLAGSLHSFLAGSGKESATNGDGDQVSLAVQKEDLIHKIDNGYLIEETGKRAEVPRFARNYLKTVVANGDA